MIPAPRLAAAVSLLLAMSACSGNAPVLSPSSFSAGPPADSSPAAAAACRQRADESFERQDRGSAIETGRDPVDSPFSSVPLKEGIRGLATRSSYNQTYADCLRSRAPGQGTRPAAGPAPGPGGIQPGISQPGGSRLGQP